MANIRTIILEDGKLTKTGNTWTYTGNRGTYTGSTAREALAKAYGINVNDVEVKIIRFKDYTTKALICIMGFCNLYDVQEHESGRAT
jgi:hypothetical protein